MISKIKENLKERIRLLVDPQYKKSRYEGLKLSTTPRYKEMTIQLFNKEFTIPDFASYHFLYKELFEKEIYRFKNTNLAPYIIDAGANIGLSIIYFKGLFPEAKITAFEADPLIFKILQKNIHSFELEDVDLINRAVWDEETTLKFNAEGADAGRIDLQSEGNIEVETVRLRSYLNRQVDFMKIDIEGAETKVIRDCADVLHHVQKLFVEYHSFVGEAQELDELIAILVKAGFRLNINTPGLVSERPFDHIQTYAGMDMQLNIYCFRP